VGGWGSGRSGWHPVVEDGLTLDFGFLRRLGGRSGTLWWSRGGERIASIGWELHLAAEMLTLNYVVGDERRPIGQFIHLVMTRPHFGGVRWWMVCPATGRRVAKLHMYGGRNYFVSRQALGMAYRSQREDVMDRALRRGDKVLAKLGRKDLSIEDAPYLPKPKWMRWRTYERAIAEAQAVNGVWDAAFCGKVGSLLELDF
jgi:hypothetical protein